MQPKERDVANERSLQRIEEREPVFIMDKRWIADLPKILEKVFELVRECPGEALDIERLFIYEDNSYEIAMEEDGLFLGLKIYPRVNGEVPENEPPLMELTMQWEPWWDKLLETTREAKAREGKSTTCSREQTATEEALTLSRE